MPAGPESQASISFPAAISTPHAGLPFTILAIRDIQNRELAPQTVCRLCVLSTDLTTLSAQRMIEVKLFWPSSDVFSQMLHPVQRISSRAEPKADSTKTPVTTFIMAKTSQLMRSGGSHHQLADGINLPQGKIPSVGHIGSKVEWPRCFERIGSYGSFDMLQALRNPKPEKILPFEATSTCKI